MVWFFFLDLLCRGLRGSSFRISSALPVSPALCRSLRFCDSLLTHLPPLALLSPVMELPEAVCSSCFGSTVLCVRIVPGILSLTFRCPFSLAPVCLSSLIFLSVDFPSESVSLGYLFNNKPELPGCSLQGGPSPCLSASPNMLLTQHSPACPEVSSQYPALPPLPLGQV